MTLDLSGKVAIVAGGARGIGRGIVEALAESGARVCLGDLDLEAALATAAATSSAGGEVSAHRLDATLARNWRDLVHDVVDKRGRLDILVYSVGIYPRGSILEMEPDVWRRVFEANLDGFYLACREAIPQMAGLGGSVVAIGSALNARANPELPAYCASKAGVAMLVRCLAQAHATENVRVNMVNPGWVDTPGERERHRDDPDWRVTGAQSVPLGRLQTAREIGDTVAFLCSEQARSVTGALWSVDGGIGCKWPVWV